ncbi:ABC transporter substrate-binding protein [Paenibacillus alkaliterrae]|uniref:ABC transporter substrate-binding protein n=1 Tax=Paenibacillus alkaliterrae TaxID=320909 RepID=UPI001F37CCC5|nr:ABC transporter substrate-binding protein [Paenibacillus alkaliterrae]MCF2939259.1 ABC transporter substrate-binding protein [Paenibacillus alkaliterrae]
MRKKFLWGIVFILIIAVISAGCSSGNQNSGGNNGNTNAASPNEENGKQPAQKELPPYEITMVFMGNESPDLERVAGELSKITKEKINATVKLQPISAGAWSQQVNLMLASNEKIDVITTSSIFGFSTQAASGHLLPLEDLLAQYGQGITELMDPAYLNAGKINGTQYAIPTNKDMATQGGIIMRKDLIDKYNIDLDKVKTVDDLDHVFQIIKENEPKLIPITTNTTFSPIDVLAFFDPLVDSLGVLPGHDNDLRVENLYEHPKYAELLTTMRRWYQAGYFSKDAATTTEQPYEVVRANRAFSWFNVMKVGSAENQSTRTGMEMVALPLTEAVSTTSNVTGFMHSIPKGSKDPERAMMFMNLLYTDQELVNMLNWGIEGEHYVKKSDHIIDYPEGFDIKSVRYNMNNSSYMFGNQFLNYVWTTQLEDIWEQVDQFNQNAKKSHALGFTFDSTPVRTESGAVNNVKQQFKLGLETGTLDPEKTLPEFISRLKASGIDKIIAEKQKQLDAWAESKK